MRISDWSSDVCSSDLEEHQYQGNELQTDEWDDTPVDVKRGALRRRHAAQVEQRPAQRRGQKRDMQVQGVQDRYPGKVTFSDRPDKPTQRQHQERKCSRERKQVYCRLDLGMLGIQKKPQK